MGRRGANHIVSTRKEIQYSQNFYETRFVSSIFHAIIFINSGFSAERENKL